MSKLTNEKKAKDYDRLTCAYLQALEERDEYRLRIENVLLMCDNNERLHSYVVATDSVRAILTDFPLDKLKQE